MIEKREEAALKLLHSFRYPCLPDDRKKVFIVPDTRRAVPEVSLQLDSLRAAKVWEWSH